MNQKKTENKTELEIIEEAKGYGYKEGIDQLIIYDCQFCGNKKYCVMPYRLQRPDIKSEMLGVVNDKNEDIKIRASAAGFLPMTLGLLNVFEQENKQILDAIDKDQQWNLPKGLQCKCREDSKERHEA